MLTKNKKDLIVVPYDFTEQSVTALEHASTIASKDTDEVRLLHIVNPQSNDRIAKAGFSGLSEDEALKKVAAENQSKTGVATTYHTEEGNFLMLIGSYSTRIKADFCVMGTHGVHGVQHILGANSMKVASSLKVPIVIVQKRHIDPNGYSKIVLPIDANKKGRNKIVYTAAMAKYFGSEVYIFEDQAQQEYLSQRIDQNSKIAQDYLSQSGVSFKIEKHTPSEETFAKHLVRYASQINANLIVISTHNDQDALSDFFFANHEVQIINNDSQIAVMCVNPVESVTHLEIGSFNW